MQTPDLRTLSLKVTTVQVTLFGAQTATVDMLSIIILMAVDSLQLLKDGKLLEQVMPTIDARIESKVAALGFKKTPSEATGTTDEGAPSQDTHDVVAAASDPRID